MTSSIVLTWNILKAHNFRNLTLFLCSLCIDVKFRTGQILYDSHVFDANVLIQFDSFIYVMNEDEYDDAEMILSKSTRDLDKITEYLSDYRK